MLFSVTSFWFLIFLVISLVAYYLSKPKIQWLTLLASSLVFVFLYDGLSVFPLLFVCIGIPYISSVLMQHFSGRETVRKSIVYLAVILELALLFVFKIYGSVSVVLNKLLSGRYFISPISSDSYLIPIGMSYFAISAVGYILDQYWDTCDMGGGRNPVRMQYSKAFFVSYLFSAACFRSFCKI